MLTFVIIFLILLGLFLIFLEFFVIPGITVAGIGGLIFSIAGISMVYHNYGAATGHTVLAVTIIFALILFVISFKSGTWDKLMLSSAVTGQVETVKENSIVPGDEGITITRLNPIGKVKVKDQIIEAKCPGQFVDPNTEVIVKEVFKTYIIVKQK
jgi:membrane-bound ClpP family serine protease